MPIAISASLAYDHIMNFPDSFKNHIMPEQLHILNVSFAVDRLERTWGGNSANIAFPIKMLGGNPIIISAVGKKDGQEYIDYLRGHGLETKYIQVDENQLTASAYITTDADDNQITAFFGAPLKLAENIDIRNIKDQISLLIVGPTHSGVMMKHLKEGYEAGIKTVFDPGQQIIAFNKIELRKMIGQCDFVIGNDYEIKLLQQRTEWNSNEILDQVKAMIITLGEKGSIVCAKGEDAVEVGSCPVQSCDDPTGAGDSYRAGFFTGYELGYSWKVCAQMGAVAAAYAVEEYGTQIMFTKEQFCERYKKTFSEEISLER
ncbi:MAG: carbohydrate kinase family protein [bacterium]